MFSITRLPNITLELLPRKRLRFPEFQQRTLQSLTTETSKNEIPLHVEPAVKSADAIKFDDYRTIFEYKATWDIIRALVVLKLCSIDSIVNNGDKLMVASRKIFGQKLYTALQKKTIYGQFVGGNSLDELMEKISALRKGGIGPLLAVPMEDDSTDNKNIEEVELQFDKNVLKTIHCLDIVSDLNDKIPMMQVKLTALMPGNICTKLSQVFPKPSQHNKEAVEQFAKWFCTDKMPNLKEWNSLEYKQLESGLSRLKTVFQRGSEKNIWLMVDAEYTYMNPALNLLTLALMMNYNHAKPLIAYTYQNYLKGTENLLQSDLDFIRSQGIGFSAKLVRGAYIDKEKMLAIKEGYPCPINDSYEDTTTTYNKSVDIIFEAIKNSREKVKTVVASHNEETVLNAIQRMKDLGIDRSDGSVVFGQVDGMGDHISYALGRAGYMVYKSVPYGDIQDTLPYLYRRLLENRSVLKGVRRERALLSSALKHRLKKKLSPI